MTEQVTAIIVIIYTWMGLFTLTNIEFHPSKSDSAKVFFGIFEVIVWPIPLVLHFIHNFHIH